MNKQRSIYATGCTTSRPNGRKSTKRPRIDDLIAIAIASREEALDETKRLQGELATQVAPELVLKIVAVLECLVVCSGVEAGSDDDYAQGVKLFL